MKEIIKFWATWCAPCKTYAPIFDSVAKEYKGQVKFTTVDIETDTNGLAAKYRVRNIPHTVLIREDGTRLTKVGVLSKEDLKELILS
jgi:thioredoxin